MKLVCRRCGSYINVLTNGYVCPNCGYQEVVVSSDSTTMINQKFETIPIIEPSQIKTYTDGTEQIVWTRKELVALIKEVVKEMEKKNEKNTSN